MCIGYLKNIASHLCGYCRGAVQFIVPFLIKLDYIGFNSTQLNSTQNSRPCFQPIGQAFADLWHKKVRKVIVSKIALSFFSIKLKFTLKRKGFFTNEIGSIVLSYQSTIQLTLFKTVEKNPTSFVQYFLDFDILKNHESAVFEKRHIFDSLVSDHLSYAIFRLTT